MRIFLIILLVALTNQGCGASASRSKSCTNAKSQTPLAIVDGQESSKFPSVVFIMAGKRSGQMATCTGTVVGHNAVLTAAHCINGNPSDHYIMQGAGYRGAEYSVALQSALSPKAIISHGTITNSDDQLTLEQMRDDLVVMIFQDQTFKQTDVIIPSLYSLSRPAQFSPVTLVGFGKSSPTDTAQSNIKRVGESRYVYSPSLWQDLVFVFDRDVDDKTFASLGAKKYSQTLQGDSGGPLLLEKQHGLEILGVVSGGGTDGSTSRSVYVDLYSSRSHELFLKAKSNGAVFNAVSSRNQSVADGLVAKESSSLACQN